MFFDFTSFFDFTLVVYFLSDGLMHFKR